MEPSPFTPSASIQVPANMEHIEARQAAIDRERMAYIDKLSPESKARFMLVEQVVATMREAKVPFFLMVKPDREGCWVHKAAHYGDPFTDKQVLEEIRDTMYTFLVTAADSLSEPLGMTVPICAPDGKVFHMANPPTKPFSPPPDDYQRAN